MKIEGTLSYSVLPKTCSEKIKGQFRVEFCWEEGKSFTLYLALFERKTEKVDFEYENGQTLKILYREPNVTVQWQTQRKPRKI